MLLLVSELDPVAMSTLLATPRSTRSAGCGFFIVDVDKVRRFLGFLRTVGCCRPISLASVGTEEQKMEPYSKQGSKSVPLTWIWYSVRQAGVGIRCRFAKRTGLLGCDRVEREGVRQESGRMYPKEDPDPPGRERAHQRIFSELGVHPRN